jgi:hypothetical protein
MDPVSYSAPASTNQTLAMPGGGYLSVSWSDANAWSSGIDSTSGTNVPPGFDEVIWGYLDDTSPGWTVTISGFRSVASSFTLQAIAASDSASGLGNINLFTNQVTADTVNFTNDPSQFIQVGGGGWGTSTVSIVFNTLAGNDSVTLRGVGRNGSIRNTLAGLILNDTGPASNPPLIESNPQAPTNTIFTGQSFSLTAAASGSLPLSYQWRFNGVPVSGATTTLFTKTGVTVGDSGNYDVVVTNTFGSVTSLVAAVTISPVAQPQITRVALSTGGRAKSNFLSLQSLLPWSTWPATMPKSPLLENPEMQHLPSWHRETSSWWSQSRLILPSHSSCPLGGTCSPQPAKPCPEAPLASSAGSSSGARP